MESAVSVGLTRGRPWGGTAVLVRKSLVKFCTEITVSERVMSLKLFEFLFVNVYMPCEDGSITALNMIHEILANVSNNIELSEAKLIIFDGDINTNITSNSSHASAINDFLLTYKMKIGNTLLESKNDTSYTFGNEKLNRYSSSIDFLCVSESLITGVTDIILLSRSVTELQTMIHVCCAELSLLDLRINSQQSSIIRIGNRFKAKCVELVADNETIQWAFEAKYLRIYIVAGPKFTGNFDKEKVKYYRTADSILAKIRNKNNATISLKTIASIDWYTRKLEHGYKVRLEPRYRGLMIDMNFS